MKRNQIMITALAIMIAVAGYLNFAGNRISEETLVVADEVYTEDDNMTALLDLSEEDIASDIESLEQDAVLTENYLEEDMQVEDMQVEEVTSDIVVDMSGNEEEASEEIVEGTPGEAVFTSTKAVSTLSAAKLLKEQTRAQNKEALEEIINNTVLDSAQKEEAVANMVAMTERSERETEAEILLSSKGFTETVVSMSEDGVDVVVCKETLSDSDLAQIMDIVMRKTKIPAENIIISQVTQQ